jgi:hypothetical protein
VQDQILAVVKIGGSAVSNGTDKKESIHTGVSQPAQKPSTHDRKGPPIIKVSDTVKPPQQPKKNPA